MAQKKRKKRLGEEWITPAEMRARLGITSDTLSRLREQKIFKSGVHWLDINPLSTPRYRYHYERCKSALVELSQKHELTD